MNKVNKNINSIITKYLDYSLNNLLSICEKNKISRFELINPDITMEDIMTMCVQRGSYGFYLYSSDGTKFLIDILYRKLEISNMKFIKNEQSKFIKFYLKPGLLCHIHFLGILKFS